MLSAPGARRLHSWRSRAPARTSTRDGDLDITGPVTVEPSRQGPRHGRRQAASTGSSTSSRRRIDFQEARDHRRQGFRPRPTPAARALSVAARHLGPERPKAAASATPATIKVVRRSITKNRSLATAVAIGVINNAGLTLSAARFRTTSRPRRRGDRRRQRQDPDHALEDHRQHGGRQRWRACTSSRERSRRSSTARSPATAAPRTVAASTCPAAPTQRLRLDITSSTISGNRAGGDRRRNQRRQRSAEGRSTRRSPATAPPRVAAASAAAAPPAAGGGDSSVTSTRSRSSPTSRRRAARSSSCSAAALLQPGPSPGFNVDNSLVALNFSGNTRTIAGTAFTRSVTTCSDRCSCKASTGPATSTSRTRRSGS